MTAEGLIREEEAVQEALIFTRWSIVGLEPASLERVAGILDALRCREPIATGAGWENERQVIGCLVTDLRTLVLAAGEPVGVQRDLRDARSRQDEVYARQRADHAIRAYDALITDAIEEDRRDREQLAQDLSHETHEPAPVTPAVATPDESVPLWL